ncbi:MAG: DUF2971 domain-containing protein [Lachnospiraceae bacterium]
MLYHYTDFIAFNGILRNAELRLNNILNMNDAAEMRLFMNGICRSVIKRLVQEGDYEKAHHAENFFQNELAEEFHYSAYAACFSKYRDDAAQWDRYGKLGTGVCIAFHEELIKKMVGGPISLQKVYYQENMEDHQLVNDMYDLITETERFSDCLEQLQILTDAAWVQSAAFKHPSFASEQEQRLVVSPFIASEFTVEPQYYVAKDRIKKYYPLNLRLMCERHGMQLADLVGEIIIGPTSPQSLPILQDFLRDCGLSVLSDKVSLSRCPLRKPIS